MRAKTQVNTTEAARLLDVHRRTVDRLVKSGVLHRDPRTKTFAYSEVRKVKAKRQRTRRKKAIRAYCKKLRHQFLSLVPGRRNRLPF